MAEMLWVIQHPLYLFVLLIAASVPWGSRRQRLLEAGGTGRSLTAGYVVSQGTQPLRLSLCEPKLVSPWEKGREGGKITRHCHSWLRTGV